MRTRKRQNEIISEIATGFEEAADHEADKTKNHGDPDGGVPALYDNCADWNSRCGRFGRIFK